MKSRWDQDAIYDIFIFFPKRCAEIVKSFDNNNRGTLVLKLRDPDLFIMSDRASEEQDLPQLSDELILWIRQDCKCYICEEKNLKALFVVEIQETGQDALVCPTCQYIGTTLVDFENTHILDVKSKFPNL